MKDPWWFKNLKTIAEHESLDEMRDIVKHYRVGSLLQEDSPEFLRLLQNSGIIEKELRILVFGPSHAGKSTLINGIFTAFEDTDIQYYRNLGGVKDTSPATTVLAKANTIRVMRDGKLEAKISFVDSRGIVESSKMESLDEVLQVLLGNSPIHHFTPHSGDTTRGKNSIIVLPPEYKRFQLGICCLPADNLDKSMILFAQKVFSEYFPMIFVITKMDQCESLSEPIEEKIWARELNIHPENIFQIENYNIDTNDTRSVKTDRVLLHLLLASIRKAELEGFQAISKDQVSVVADSLHERMTVLVDQLVHQIRKMDCTHVIILLWFLLFAVILFSSLHPVMNKA
jgi:predicted GTPase